MRNARRARGRNGGVVFVLDPGLVERGRGGWLRLRSTFHLGGCLRLRSTQLRRDGARRLRTFVRLVVVVFGHQRFTLVCDVLAADARAAACEQPEADRGAALGRRIDLHRDRDEPETERERCDRARHGSTFRRAPAGHAIGGQRADA